MSEMTSDRTLVDGGGCSTRSPKVLIVDIADGFVETPGSRGAQGIRYWWGSPEGPQPRHRERCGRSQLNEGAGGG